MLMPDIGLSEIRHQIHDLHEARELGWLSDIDQVRYDELLAVEVSLLADLRSRGVPVPGS
jgi:hypothetical protein